MNRRDVAVVVFGLALLGLATFRVLNPSAPPTRQLSVEGMTIETQPIRSGQSLVAEAVWTPPDDVFVVGWTPEIGARAAQPSLYLRIDNTTLFAAGGLSPENLRSTFLPGGVGFLLRKEQQLKLRLEIANSGPDGETRGARAFVYFHPVSFR